MLWISTAAAGVLGTYGGAAVPGNAGVAAPSTLSSWSNPAAMRSEKVDGSAEYLLGRSTFGLDGQELSPSYDTDGLLLGVVVNGYWLRLPRTYAGLSVFMPRKGPFSWYEVPPEDETYPATPHVPRFESELDRLDLAGAVSADLVRERLAVGLGFDVSAEVETYTFVEVEDADVPEEAGKGQAVTISPTFHPYLGLWGSVGPLQLGLVGRTERKMHDFGATYVDVQGLEVLYRHEFIRHYAPPSVTLGGAVSMGEGLSVRAEGSWERWSGAVDPFGEPLGWSDTVTGRAGLEWTRQRLWASGGYGFDPGNAPNGLMLDGLSHAATLGAGWRFDRVSVQAGLRARVFPDDGGFSGRFLAGSLGVRW
jgi:hypothetical protein